MKFFRTSRGETYVAQPPAVIDPTPGRDAAAQPRPAIRPAHEPAAIPPTATARSLADPAQARRIPDAAPHARAPDPAPASATAPVQTAPKQDGSDRWGRRPPQPLTIASHQLAIDLARSGDPVPGLARRFPHVLNQLSAVWGDLPAAAELVDHLLVDRRGGRSRRCCLRGCLSRSRCGRSGRHKRGLAGVRCGSRRGCSATGG
jgi:hypothetical protein